MIHIIWKMDVFGRNFDFALASPCNQIAPPKNSKISVFISIIHFLWFLSPSFIILLHFILVFEGTNSILVWQRMLIKHMTCPPVLVNLWVGNCYIWQSVYKYCHLIYCHGVNILSVKMSLKIWNHNKGIAISPPGCWCTRIKSFASIGKLRTIYSWFRLVSISLMSHPLYYMFHFMFYSNIQLWNNQKTHLDHWVTQAGRFLNNRKRENTLIWSLNSCSKGWPKFKIELLEKLDLVRPKNNLEILNRTSKNGPEKSLFWPFVR